MLFVMSIIPQAPSALSPTGSESSSPFQPTLIEAPVGSTTRRWFALWIDSFVLSLLSIPVFLTWNWREFVVGGALLLSWGILITWAMGGFLFQAVFLKWKAATPGKLALGLRVVPIDSRQTVQTAKLEWSHATLRSLAAYLNWIAGLVFVAPALLSPHRRTAIDLIAGTRVIQATPWAHPPRARWVLGSLAILFSLGSAINQWAASQQSFSVTREGIVIQVPRSGK